MHGESVVRADADDHIVKDGGAGRPDQNLDDLSVGHVERLGICGGHMDVALGDDNALRNIQLTGGADQPQSGGAGDIAALTDRDILQSQRACIGEGQLNLILRPGGTQHTDCHLPLGTDQTDLLVGGGKLPGLTEHLFDGQCRALAVQNPDGFVGQMDVACRRLDKEFVFHFSSVPLS